ncbi:hypothetical protein AB0N28_15545, partial [Streptomyces sp. NPDC051130]
MSAFPYPQLSSSSQLSSSPCSPCSSPAGSGARPVPLFPPLRVGRGGDRLGRALRRRRRAGAAGLAV